jgi:hypothetical protein
MDDRSPMIQRSLGETVDYAAMRALPITVFGTSSSGSFVNQTHRNPAEVLGKYVTYADLEAQTPHEDTVAALLALVKHWTTTIKGRSKVARSGLLVHAGMLEHRQPEGKTHTSQT